MNMVAYPSTLALAFFYRLVGGIGLGVAGLTLAWWAFRRWNRSTPHEPVTGDVADRVTWGLGALWLLDGLLQMQPLMVTHFIGGFLTPLVSGQPPWLQAAIRVGIALWAINPVVWNALAAWLQVGIGLVLLFARDPGWRRAALWISVGWSAVVWVAGEAMGGVFSGGSWFSGSPGSVLFYGLLAVWVLASPDWRRRRGQSAVRYGLGGLWTLAALEQAWPANGFWGPALSQYVASMAAMPQPGWLSAPLYAWAHVLSSAPAAWNAGLVAIFAALGGLWFFAPDRLATFWATMGVVLLTWYFGQDWGVLGGMGTDPNSGAPVLLALFIYPLLSARKVLASSPSPFGAAPRVQP